MGFIYNPIFFTDFYAKGDDDLYVLLDETKYMNYLNLN